jgi:integrase
MVYGHMRPDGTRPRKFKTVHGGVRAAQQAERTMLSARDAGKLDVKTPTVKVYAKSWQTDRAKDVAPKTAEKHAYALGYILSALGPLRLAAVNTIALRGFKDALSETDLSGTTQRMVWDILSQIMTQAAREGYIMGNPCALVKPPQKDTAESEHLSKAEAKRLRKALSDPRVLLAADFMLATAARPGEALAVTWADVDLDAATVILRATKTTTRAGERVVPLSSRMVKVIRRHKAVQDELRQRVGDKWRGDLVFPSRLGAPWTVRAFRQAWRKAGGSEFCTPYALRHTAITWWLQAGMRMALVSQLAGHAQETTTANTYSHTDASELEDARRILDTM